MDVRDLFIGLAIIFLIGWVSFLQLGVANLSNTVGTAIVQQAEQTVLFSPEGHCPEKTGLVLVPKKQLSGEEYTIIALEVNGKKALCFYQPTTS